MEASGLSLFLACVALPVGSDGWERVVLSFFFSWLRLSPVLSILIQRVQREQKKCNCISNKIFDHLIDELKTCRGCAPGRMLQI